MPSLYRSDRIRAQDESLVPIMEHFEAVCLLDEFHVLSSFSLSACVFMVDCLEVVLDESVRWM